MLCPYCKGEIPDDAKKCMNCGEWVDPAYRKPQNNEQQGCLAGMFELFASVTWFALLLIIAGIAVYLFLDWNGLVNQFRGKRSEPIFVKVIK